MSSKVAFLSIALVLYSGPKKMLPSIGVGAFPSMPRSVLQVKRTVCWRTKTFDKAYIEEGLRCYGLRVNEIGEIDIHLLGFVSAFMR